MDDDGETLEAISTLQSLLDSTTLALAHGMEPFFAGDYEIPDDITIEDNEGDENPEEWLAEIESILQRDNTEILQNINELENAIGINNSDSEGERLREVESILQKDNIEILHYVNQLEDIAGIRENDVTTGTLIGNVDPPLFDLEASGEGNDIFEDGSQYLGEIIEEMFTDNYSDDLKGEEILPNVNDDNNVGVQIGEGVNNENHELQNVQVRIDGIGSKKCPKLGCSQDFWEVDIKIMKPSSTREAISSLREGFKNMLQRTLWGGQQEQSYFLRMDRERRLRSRVTIEHPALDIPINLPFLLGREITEQRILEEIEKIETSKKEFFLDGNFRVTVSRVVLPVGGRNKKDKMSANLKSSIRRLRRFIEIRNKDELCFGRALVVAKAKVDNDPVYNAVRSNTSKTQEKCAKEMYEKAGVPIGKCGPEEWGKFQHILPDHQIVIVSGQHGNAIIFQGPQRQKRLILYLNDEHYDVITSMTAFMNKSYFCWSCMRGYDRESEHFCARSFCHSRETRECGKDDQGGGGGGRGGGGEGGVEGGGEQIQDSGIFLL